MEFIGEKGNRDIVEGWSLFLHMKAEDFLCSNVDYDMILNSIRTMKLENLKIAINISETQNISANNTLLEIIKAYDLQQIKSEELLQFAISMSDILLDEEPVSIINRLQIIKRKRPLSNDEIASLVILRNKTDQNKLLNCAIAILLDETENAKNLLGEIPEMDRKLITDYPIYSLIKSKE